MSGRDQPAAKRADDRSEDRLVTVRVTQEAKTPFQINSGRAFSLVAGAGFEPATSGL